MDKGYRLTEPYSNGIKDKCPDWMHNVLEKKEKISNEMLQEIQSINKPNLNKTAKHCSLCNGLLSEREIGKCNVCRKK